LKPRTNSADRTAGLRGLLFLFGSLAFVCTQAVAGQATLAWDPSPDPTVIGYSLHYGEASRNYSAKLDTAAGQTTLTVPNLLEGRNYYFAVTARSSTGAESGFSNEVSGFIATTGTAPGTVLNSAVLPASRAARVGAPITVYATMVNAGSAIGTGCSIGLASSIPASFSYQTTNASTNTVSGTPNTPVDIVSGAAQSFLLTLTPSAAFDAADVQFNYSCANAPAAGVLTGINTLLLSASTTATPDVIALAATTSNDGIASIPGTSGTAAWAVASTNVGSAGSITASADTGPTALPINVALCQTNPNTGSCLQPAAASVPVTMASGGTSTFAVFVGGAGSAVPFNPATNRVYLRFRNAANGAVVGATSVAVQTR
jgi:hypothetical protein